MPPGTSAASNAALVDSAEAPSETIYKYRRLCVLARRIAPVAACRVGVGGYDQRLRHSALGECRRLRRSGYTCNHATA
jgi:hypothetical protein